jgi:deaminated glutathione amidase
MNLRVAALQMRSGLSPRDNVAPFEGLVREAAAKGATYIQSPEMTGAIQRDRAALKASITSGGNDLIVQAAQRLAAELKVTIHIGSMPVLPDDHETTGLIANRAFVIGPDGTIIATYDKIHMFDVDLPNGESWRESAAYAPGGEAVLIDLATAEGPASVGLGICYDLRFAELFRAYALAGAQILTVPAAFTKQTGEAHWHVLLRARAIETGSFVIAAAQGGTHDDGRETYGHSLIIDPWGKVLAEKADAEPGVIVADLDLALVSETRARIPNLRNARAFSMTRAAAKAGSGSHRGAQPLAAE